MLSLLTTFCISSGSKYVTEIDDRSFSQLVEKRDNRTVWILDFQATYCPACSVALPLFTEAAGQFQGMARFGSVDTQKSPIIAQRFQIRYIPTFIIFYPGGHKVYLGERTTRGFCNGVAKYIPNNSKEIDDSWAEGSNNEAILFTNKERVPPMWAAISNSFYENKEGIQIGHTLNQTKMKLFNVTSLPTVLVRDGENSRIFEGKPNFLAIKQFITKFFDGTLPEPTQKPSDNKIETIDTTEKFQKLCHKNKYCVVMVGEPNDDLKKIAAKSHRYPFIFATSPAGSKIGHIEKGIWVFHRTQQKCVFVESLEKLNTVIDRIIDGSLHWKSIDDAKMDQEL